MGQVVTEAVREIFGHTPLIYPSIGASNPSYLFHEVLGIPLLQVPYANFDESNHAPNENLLLDFYRKGIKTTARVICGLAGL